MMTWLPGAYILMSQILSFIEHDCFMTGTKYSGLVRVPEVMDVSAIAR